MKRNMSLRNLMAMVLVLAFVSGACNFLMPPRETPAPALTPTEAIPTDVPTPAPPTATPGPTPTLMPLPAPRLLYRAPETGETQSLDAPLELIFDQPMDRESVAQSFSISPTVEGELSWADSRTLRFEPRQGLARGAVYHVRVGESARNVEGQALVEPIRFDFQTVGYLSVGEVQPLPGSEDIDPDTAVTVVFNRPVVPLTAIEQQADLPAPLSFSPSVEGKGEWLNSAIYRFRPTRGFQPATTYKATIAAGLRDTMGSVLEDGYAWTFSTQRPDIVSRRPSNNAEHVGPTDVVSITFNQPMDHASVEESFSLFIGGRELGGTFRWSKPQPGDFPADVGRFETMGFVPNVPLPRNTELDAILLKSARAYDSVVTLDEDVTWSFSTVKTPSILSTSPVNDETGVDTGRDVNIVFASPMQIEGFMDYVNISPQPTRVYTYWYESDTELRLSFPMTPVTTYRLTLAADVPDKYAMPLGQALNLRFTTGNLSPYVRLYVGAQPGTFNAYTDTVIYAGHRNVKRLDVELYRLSVQAFMNMFGYGSYRDRQTWLALSPDDLVRKWSVTLDTPLNASRMARLDMQTAAGTQLPPGIYHARISSPEVQAYDPDARPVVYNFIRSRINLTFKQAHHEMLVWATDLETGQPVPNLSIRLHEKELGWHGEGSSDDNGLYAITEIQDQNLWRPYFAFSGEPGEETFAVASNDWDSGIRPWNFDLMGDYSDSQYVAYLYTDRPIYRPGQTVYFKGVLRADDDAHYTIPDYISELSVNVSDPQGKQIYSETLSISDMGTFYSELTLDDEAALGTYYMQVSGDEWNFYASTSFRLAEYRKPEFQVAVQTDRDAYLNEDDINITAEATYYFGGPVANAEVDWNVLSSNYTFRYQCPQNEKCPWYSWTDYEWGREEDTYGSYGRLIAEGDAETDAQGRLTFKVPADLAEERNSRRFTLEVNVTDINDQYVSNRTSTIVHKGEFYTGIAPRGRIAKAGEEKGVDLLTVDWASVPVPGVDLTVIFMEHRWYSVRQQAEDGNYYWTWSVEDVPVYTTTVTTDDNGAASTVFTPTKSGSYRARVIGQDARGNEIRSSTYIWVWGGGRASWRQESNNRIDLIVDQDEYQVGDTAEILIPSPYTGTVNALVTIERGHIIETEVRELRSNTEVLQIPIVEAHAPNIFVSVVLVQGSAQAPDALASFKVGMVQLPVSVAEKELQITLTPDRDMESGGYYHPRETAIYNVSVTDHAGQPVEAELSLRLADLAVLALADEVGPTLLEHYWSRRGLGVRTAMPLALAMEAYNRELAPKAKGGGGGAGDEGFIRSRFADTAYWNPVVRTDASGHARVEVKLPDNLTTWRMQARGITADTRVGRAEVDILSTLDLLVRPVLPRFFVVGDRADIATVVHNNTGQTLATDVVLTVEGLEVKGESYQTVNILPGDKARLVWPVTVLDVDEVMVRMEAEAGTYYDGREDTLPVYRYATPEMVATAGRLSGPDLRQEIVQLPRDFDPTQGGLTVQVDGSLTAATQDTLDYLEHYPYECVEQTVSRFMPNVLTYQILNEMGLARPELEQKLTEQVRVALQRLYAQQHYDGGWGWWQSDRSNVYLTAYVLHGLLEAHRAGFMVDDEVLHNGVDFLRDNLTSLDDNISHWRANRLAYQLYVLGEYARVVKDAELAGELGYAVNLFENRIQLDQYGKATLAVALGLLDPEEQGRVKTLLSELAGDAVYSATGTHWEERQPDYWNMSTDTRSTAMVLWAMARHRPESDLLPNVVRWLMNARGEDARARRYWESTHTTSWAMIGLIAYMRASGELQGDFSYTVTLNGEVLLAGDVSKVNLDERQQVEVDIAQLLVDEGNRLIIERFPPLSGQSGAGQLYYTAHLRYFLPVTEVEALDRGIVVARRYEMPDSQALNVKVGDLIRVKLTVIAPADLYYVVVEDPLPAGCEAVDLGLKTTSVVGERPDVHNLTAEQEDYWYQRYGWGWWWFSHSEIRDEKVALFATYLPRGTYEYSYVMRASVPGTYNVIPASAYEMYFPEVWGRSDGGQFTVQGD